MKTRNIVKDAVEKLGYKELRKAQIQPINDLLDRKDILLIAPTSMGKSAVFQVPGLARAKEGWVLVVEPTLALIHDQVHRLQSKGIYAAYLTGENSHERNDILNKLSHRAITFLFTTPEQLDQAAPYARRKILQKLEEQNLRDRVKETLRQVRKHVDDGSVIVYATTRSSVEYLHNQMKAEQDLKSLVVRYHADMTNEKKEKILKAFLSGKKRIILATSAFGMGIDQSNVRLVLHFELPLSPVEWYQQIGRAGRDGKKAHAILLYREQDIKRNQAMLRDKNQIDLLMKSHKQIYLAEQHLALERLDDLVQILTNGSCLMQGLLSYLGEKDPPVCGHCTICQRNRKLGGGA